MTPTARITFQAWVEAARTNLHEYRRRQLVEIVLHAIGAVPTLRSRLLLKGGALMNLVYRSSRATTDVDFTAPSEFSEAEVAQIVADLDTNIAVAAQRLGYLQLTCLVQSIKKKPRRPDARFPTVAITIGSASRREPSEMARLLDRRAIHIATLEVSFNELVCEVDEIYLGEGDESILAYSVYDLVAEKLRALLQQTQRNRFRRQDVYDIALILRDRKFDVEEREKVLQTLLAKARSREIEPDADAIEMPEIIERARSEYGTLKLELGDQPLDFDADFGLVADFYRSLPWD